VDDGNQPGSGFVPFDDEGTKAEETYLIKNGILSGRLHSSVTSASLGESLTGNARAINFEYEPIVRMTSTYIKPGTKSFEEIIKDIDKGVYIESFNHGSGMSTFTIAPKTAFMIRDGNIAEPVKISVITGNVFETLNLIEDATEEYRLRSMIGGGCGKMEQFPLSVSFGGPFIKIKTMNVQ
jgi:TldD protein